MSPDLEARFLVDAQLPLALVRWSGQGYEAAHVFDHGLAGVSDRLIWKRAADTGAVIITKDEFALRRTLEDIGPAVVWLRLGNTRKAALFRWLEPLLPDILVALERGETLIEVA